MNGDTTTKGYDHLRVYTMDDAKDFLTALQSSLNQLTKNTAQRAVIAAIGLHDLTVPVCEMMSLLGNGGLAMRVLKKDTLAARRTWILKKLPATSKALSIIRAQLYRFTWSQPGIWQGSDRAAAKFISHRWYDIVLPTTKNVRSAWSAMQTALGRNRLAALLKAHIRLCKICRKSLHKSHASAKVHRRCSAAYQRQRRKRET